MGLLSKVKALGSLTRKKKYSKEELRFIEEARRALIDWGVACETAGPAEVEALYLLEQRKVRIYVAGTDNADTALLLRQISEAIGASTKPDTLLLEAAARVATGVVLLEAADVKFVRLPDDPDRWRDGAAAILFVTSFSSVDGLDDALTRYGSIARSFEGVALHLVANTCDFEVYGLKDSRRENNNYEAAKQSTLDSYRRLSDAQGRVFYNHALDFEEMGTVGTFVDQFLEVTLRQLLPDEEEEADDDRPILEEPPEPRLSHAEQVKLAIENLPPPPPPSEYPLRVVVEQEEGAENEITGKVEEAPEEEPAPDPPTGVEATDRFRAKFEESLFQQLTEKGIDEETARARAKEKAAALPARVAKPPPVAPEKGEARQWRASGLEVRSTPADAYRDKYRSDDVEALRRDLDASLD